MEDNIGMTPIEFPDDFQSVETATVDGVTYLNTAHKREG